MKDVVILFSGGADSVLMLKFAEIMKRKVHAVMVDYGQLHIEELEYAKKFLDENNIENTTIKISGYNVNSGLTGDGQKGGYDGVSIYNVPARNTIFLSLAYGIAESKGIDEVWFGADMSDYFGKFPDCAQEYVGRVNHLFEISGVKPIKVRAPLLGLTKEMVLEMIESYGISTDKIYSGYKEFS